MSTCEHCFANYNIYAKCGCHGATTSKEQILKYINDMQNISKSLIKTDGTLTLKDKYKKFLFYYYKALTLTYEYYLENDVILYLVLAAIENERSNINNILKILDKLNIIGKCDDDVMETQVYTDMLEKHSLFCDKRKGDLWVITTANYYFG